MAPSKGLAMSIILNQKFTIEEAELIPIAVGVSIAKAIENRGAKPQLNGQMISLLMVKNVVECSVRARYHQILYIRWS